MRWLMLVALLAGCATATPMRNPFAEICVPPELPAVSEWRPGQATPLALDQEDGASVVVAARFYEVGHRIVRAMWWNGALAIIDMQPDRAHGPVWVDSGLVSDELAFKVGGTSLCRWKRILVGGTDT